MLSKSKDSSPEPMGAFYADLEKLLRQQIEQAPSQIAVRMKLLDLYFETGRREDFLREARQLHARIKNPSQSPDWQKCASMGHKLHPAESLFAGSDLIEFVSPTPADAKATRPLVRRFGEDPRHRPLFEGLSRDCEKVLGKPGFAAEFERELISVARRPSLLMHARRLSEELGGGRIFFKREDLSPDDTHLTLGVLGTALLARQLGRQQLVTSTSDGRRGVITASVAARLGLKATVFMDAGDLQRQSSNVFRMRLLGATLRTVQAGKCRNGDVREAALDHWAQHAGDALLVLALDAAPQPFPMLSQEFTATIGRECRRQVNGATQRPPDVLVARAGNNADALGFFPPFLSDTRTRLVCVEPGKMAPAASGPNLEQDPFDTRISLSEGKEHTARRILEGLEYPSVTREHAWLKASGRVEYIEVPWKLARKTIEQLSRLEGLIPALETAHAVAAAGQIAQALPQDHNVVVIMSEDAGKDIWDISRRMGELP